MLANSLKGKGTLQESGEKIWQRDMHREHKMVPHLRVLDTEPNEEATSNYTHQNAWKSSFILQIPQNLFFRFWECQYHSDILMTEHSSVIFLEFWETILELTAGNKPSREQGWLHLLVLSRLAGPKHSDATGCPSGICTATQIHITDRSIRRSSIILRM